MTTWEYHQRRKQDVKTRATTPNHMYDYCRAMDCNKPSRAGTSDGLDTRYCRSHYDHHQRHGNPFKGTYRAKEINPYRQAALLWLMDHEDDHWVQQAIVKVRSLYRRAGQHVEAFRLRGMQPRERAWAHWVRLRTHEVDPRLVVAAWMAVEMILKDDPQPDWRKEYKHVQAAKVVHRMASGSHKKWVHEYASHSHTEELHVYPRPRGRILRHIGEDLEGACELLDYHLADVHAFRNERDAIARFDTSPYPKGWSARKRVCS